MFATSSPSTFLVTMCHASLCVLLLTTLVLLLTAIVLRVWGRLGPVVCGFLCRMALVATIVSLLLPFVLAGRFSSVWTLPPTTETSAPPAGSDLSPAVPTALETPSASAVISRGVLKGGWSLSTTPSATEERPQRHGWAAGMALWLLGTLVLLARLMAGHLWLRRLFREAVPVCEGRAAQTFADLCASLGLSRPRLLTHPGVSAPFAGVVRTPAVFLSAAVQADLDDVQLRAVLAHELSHLARRDCEWLLLARLACAALWMHPLLWWLCRRMEDAGEEAADAQAVTIAGCARPAYAAALVRLAECFTRGRWECAVGITPAPSSLERRIHMILRPSSALPLAITRRRRLATGALLSLPILAGLLLFGGAPRSSLHAQAASPPSQPEPQFPAGHASRGNLPLSALSFVPFQTNVFPALIMRLHVSYDAGTLTLTDDEKKATIWSGPVSQANFDLETLSGVHTLKDSADATLWSDTSDRMPPDLIFQKSADGQARLTDGAGQTLWAGQLPPTTAGASSSNRSSGSEVHINAAGVSIEATGSDFQVSDDADHLLWAGRLPLRSRRANILVLDSHRFISEWSSRDGHASGGDGGADGTDHVSFVAVAGTVTIADSRATLDTRPADIVLVHDVLQSPDRPQDFSWPIQHKTPQPRIDSQTPGTFYLTYRDDAGRIVRREQVNADGRGGVETYSQGE